MQKYNMHQCSKYDLGKDEILPLLAEMMIALNVELETVTFLSNNYKRMIIFEILRLWYITRILQIITINEKENIKMKIGYLRPQGSKIEGQCERIRDPN